MKLILWTVALFVLSSCVDAGVIKDIATTLFKPKENEDGIVRESSPICGHNIFATSDQRTISPEFIFITNQATNILSPDQNGDEFEARRRQDEISEVAREYRFHVENVTLEDLERHGFNRDAPTSFIMHGFTSGYPLQAWISAIVESYTIDRENKAKLTMPASFGDESGESGDFGRRPARQRARQKRQGFRSPARLQEHGFNQPSDFHNQDAIHQHSGNRAHLVQHNLFIINWNYASRGILYPRAVANIPKVATFATRFINEKLLREAGMDSRHIQLIGHSLGAHLAGFIGKNTRSKLGRIYGLDPAGPCFGTLSGSLYPSSQRLAPTDAEEVVTIQTNSALLGIDKPLGKYSIYVEGGAEQPGCKGSTVIKSIAALTWDGNDFDDIACSHSRAPNLLTYRIDQSESQEDCQMVAYECKDWESFVKGRCGVCYHENQRGQDFSGDGPMRPVDCYRIGLDWQYSSKSNSGFHQNRPFEGSSNNRPPRPNQGSGFGFGSNSNQGTSPFGEESIPNVDSDFVNRPQVAPPRLPNQQQFNRDQDSSQSGGRNRRTSTTRRPARFEEQEDNSGYSDNDNVWRRNAGRSRRATNSSQPQESVRQQDNNQFEGEKLEPKKMFLRTTDTQPYCTFHYQLILELNEPFPRNKRAPMSLVMQDSQGRSGSIGGEQNTITHDNFGDKYDDRTYTHLITSTKKARRFDHATLIFRDGLSDGNRILKSIQVNYMSNKDPEVRRRLSGKLCLVMKDTHANHREGQDNQQQQNRFFFEPCNADNGFNSRPQNEFDQGSSFNSGRQPLGTTNNGPSQFTRQPTREPQDPNDQREPWNSGSSNGREPWTNNNKPASSLDADGNDDDDEDKRRPSRRPNNTQGGRGRPTPSSSSNGRQPWNQWDQSESSSGSTFGGRRPWENSGSSQVGRRPWNQDEEQPLDDRQPWSSQNGGRGSQGGRRPTSSQFDDNRQPWNNQPENPMGSRGTWNPPRSPRPSATELLNSQRGRDRWKQDMSPMPSSSLDGREPWGSSQGSSFNPRDPRLQNPRNPQAGARPPWNHMDPFGQGGRDRWNHNSGPPEDTFANQPFDIYSRSLTNITSFTGNSTTTMKPASTQIQA